MFISVYSIPNMKLKRFRTPREMVKNDSGKFMGKPRKRWKKD
jgi:hypothetical protein